MTPKNGNTVFHRLLNPKYQPGPITPSKQNSIKSLRSFPRSSAQLLLVNKVVDNFKEVFQAGSLNYTMTDDQFLTCCKYFDAGIVDKLI